MQAVCRLATSLMHIHHRCLHTCKFTFSIIVYISGHTVVVLSLCEDFVKNCIITATSSDLKFLFKTYPMYSSYNTMCIVEILIASQW